MPCHVDDENDKDGKKNNNNHKNIENGCQEKRLLLVMNPINRIRTIIGDKQRTNGDYNPFSGTLLARPAKPP